MSLHHIHKGSEYFLNAVLIKAGCLVLIAVIVMMFPYSSAQGAVQQAVLKSFGGRVTFTQICTCQFNPGMYMVVSRGTGRSVKIERLFVSPFFTQAYDNFVPRPPVSIKGLALRTGSIPCMQTAGPTACTPTGLSGSLVQKFGTSKQ